MPAMRCSESPAAQADPSHAQAGLSPTSVGSTAASPADCNLLLITLDQLRADVLFGALHESVSLPALDRLMAEGVRCGTSYTARPL